MKEFILFYRNPVDQSVLSQQQRDESMNAWQNWFESITAEGKLANIGNRIGREGKTILSNLIVNDSPVVANNEFIGGYSIISAENFDEAVKVAKGCPILNIGGSVEVRDIVEMG